MPQTRVCLQPLPASDFDLPSNIDPAGRFFGLVCYEEQCAVETNCKWIEVPEFIKYALKAEIQEKSEWVKMYFYRQLA